MLTQGGIWFAPNLLAFEFNYKHWADFKQELPYESLSWKQRNMQILSWAVENRILQIVFITNQPRAELNAWKVPFEITDEPEIDDWLRLHCPLMWQL
jgi:hypothetical protein